MSRSWRRLYISMLIEFRVHKKVIVRFFLLFFLKLTQWGLPCEYAMTGQLVGWS